MPPIILTPGTFNPPATPVEHAGVFIFPKQPDVTLNRRPQQSSRGRVVGFPPLPALPLPVKYTDVEFAPTGNITVGVNVPSLDLSKPNFTTTGATYVPNGLYVKTSGDGDTKRYSAVGPPIFGGAGTIELGGFSINQTSGPHEWYFEFLLPYHITMEGASIFDGYNFRLVDSSPDGSDDLSGTALIRVSVPNVSPSGGTVDLDAYQGIRMLLFSAGETYDSIFVGIRVKGTFVIAPLYEPGAPTPRPADQITLGTYTDTLYGADAASTPVTEPGFDYGYYRRESFATRGTLTLS